MAEKAVRFSEESLESTDIYQLPPSLDDFNTAKLGYTPKISGVNYRNPHERLTEAVAPPSSITRPNCEDYIRRVSVVLHQHVVKCENRLARATPETMETGLFHSSKMIKFSEENFVNPQYVYHFVRAPIIRLGFLYGIRELKREPRTPNLNEIHDFLSKLFVYANLSPECSIGLAFHIFVCIICFIFRSIIFLLCLIVCLIYVERLMENGNVPLVASTWRPCILCGLLLASKVWQDIA